MGSLTDTKTIRERARKDLEDGAVTPDYKFEKDEVVNMLNGVLATEIVCVLRYRFHYFMATGIHKEGAAAEFIQRSNEELGHADLLAERIDQLGGKPEMDPAKIAALSHSEYVEGTSLEDMLREDLIAERIASKLIVKWSITLVRRIRQPVACSKQSLRLKKNTRTISLIFSSRRRVLDWY